MLDLGMPLAPVVATGKDYFLIIYIYTAVSRSVRT